MIIIIYFDALYLRKISFIFSNHEPKIALPAGDLNRGLSLRLTYLLVMCMTGLSRRLSVTQALRYLMLARPASVIFPVGPTTDKIS